MANRIDALRKKVDSKEAKKLELDKLERIKKRLEEFSPECETCTNHLNDLEEHLDRLLAKEEITSDNFAELKKMKNELASHLQKTHHLVLEGHNLALYMAIGISIGTALGLTVFDNAAIGTSLGLAMGVAIGAGKDEEAKKKGLML
ncbi:hypothetical protein [Halobacillus salinus]|uniref:hypothetical protein n=1 Tax=Halobacillus salinus TaxID=192814 RepID=UPI001C37D261|nr:hypothetical protein [Halobacillus salinus]